MPSILAASDRQRSENRRVVRVIAAYREVLFLAFVLELCRLRDAVSAAGMMFKLSVVLFRNQLCIYQTRVKVIQLYGGSRALRSYPTRPHLG